MTQWQCNQITLKYQLSDWTVFRLPFQLQVKHVGPFNEANQGEPLTPPAGELINGSQGFLIRGVPIDNQLPVISKKEDYICYSSIQYDHSYIDLRLSFEDYQKSFSSKTRSTIRRKVKKYSNHCSGKILWKTYKHPHEIKKFFQIACKVSKLTYQARLLDVGLPETEAFIQQAEALSAKNRLRAYILFDGDRPVSYLYCPINNGILTYSYQGYDPDYMKLSVGTVLQWLATEQLFSEGAFRYFDFTEGQSDHKRLFSTHNIRCANIFMLKNTLKNNTAVYMHFLFNRLSGWLGKKTLQLGIKAKIKHLLRRSA